MSALRFTLADLERANAEWGCNCGPASLAAICGLTLDEVRAAFGPAWPGYTNVRMMLAALDRASAPCRGWANASDGDGYGIAWPRYGLALIQWEGPWTEPCAPSRERYARLDRAKRTHWVGVRQAGYRGRPGVDIWDINALADGLGGWRPLEWWSGVIVPVLTADIKRATGGWHITHAIEVNRP